MREDGRLWYSNLGGLSFGADEEGNWGYKPGGADAVIPFKKESVIKNYGQVSSGNITADFPNYAELTTANFILKVTGASSEPGRHGGNSGSEGKSIYPSLSYNSATGVFSVSGTSAYQADSGKEMFIRNLSISYNVICIA